MGNGILYLGDECYRQSRPDISDKPPGVNCRCAMILIKVKCDYCLKMRPEEKTLELGDGSRICILCLAGEVECTGKTA